MATYNIEKKGVSSSQKMYPDSPPLNAEKSEKADMYDKNKKTGEGCVQDGSFKATSGLEGTTGSPENYVLILSSIVGLHLVRRGHDGTFVTCWWAVVSFGILSLGCIMSIPPVVITLFRSEHFWYQVILVPYAYGFSYCAFSYIQVAYYRQDVINFLEAAASLKRPVTGHSWQMVAWTIFLPMQIVLCSLMFFLGWPRFLFVPSVVVVSVVPTVLDSYMVGLVKMIQQAVVKLTEEVKTRKTWTLEDAQYVMSDWYQTAELLKLYNKMFGSRVHVRVMGLLLNGLSYTFILWAMDDFGDQCIKLGLATLVLLSEVLGRLYHLCMIGQTILCAGETLLVTVTEAAHKAGLGTPSCEILSELATRLEASPLSIKSTGMESLSARTYVKMTGVMLTYVVVLLQFCQRSTNSSKSKQDPTIFYHHCFLPANATLS